MKLTTEYADSLGVSIGYQVMGEGSRDLLFMQGGYIPVEAIHEEPHFARFVRRLASFGRLIMFDRRGVGLSDPISPADPPTLEQWAADAQAVLAAAGSEQTALIGYDTGGYIAAFLAASAPARTQALVLLNTAARTIRANDYPIGVPRSVLDAFINAMERGWGKDPPIELWAPSMADDAALRAWTNQTFRRGASPATARTLVRVYTEIDIRGILPAIRVPTLVIHRAENTFYRPEFGRYLAEHIAGARYIEVPGRDHLPYIGETEPILSEIEEFVTGARTPVPADRILATVLFTDIVASTERAAELGDRRWRETLESHHALLTREVERSGGRLVKTTGDGGLATFEAPARAIRCAQTITKAARYEGVEIRAGLHTGECEIMGEDVGGIAVHIGARVASLAGPGEVLVSRTVTDLVAGSGIEFDDRGEHELKGVPGQWRLYSVKT